MVLSNAKVQRV